MSKEIEVVYKGRISEDGLDGMVIRLTGEEQVATVLPHYKHHSSKFSWGYEGSGPADLARSLLADVLGREVLDQPWVYQEFKDNVVSTWGREWTMTSSEIKKWYRTYLSQVNTR